MLQFEKLGCATEIVLQEIKLEKKVCNLMLKQGDTGKGKKSMH